MGTPERQIIEACAAQISAAYMGQYLTGGMMDINTKSGLELDQFVGIFGFGRLQGTAASGVIQVTTTNLSTTALTIPINSQFLTTPGLAGLSTTLYFASTQAVTIPAGSYQASVPVQCTTVGTQGNVPPDSVTSQAAAIGSVVVTNTAAMTGGTNAETDAQLRQRFMDTLLRNISGTSDWYENIALQNNSVARVKVFGPVSLYATQIAVPASNLTLSLTSNVKYVWCLTPETRVLTDGLDWVPVGSLALGDKLVGFDENPAPGRGQSRYWRQAEVTNNSVVKAPTFTVKTTYSSVTCTGDHLWLVSFRNGKKQKAEWVKTRDLLAGDKIRYVPTWDEDRSWEAGYISGIFDGEGSVPSRTYHADFCQNPGPVLDKALSILKDYGFATKCTERNNPTAYSPDYRCVDVRVNGGAYAMMRFFGTFKPERLLPKFMGHLYGSSTKSKTALFAEVVSVTPAGVQDVVELSTSTHTLLAEGLFSHNTGGNSCFTGIGTDSEVFYSPVDDYELSSGAAPVFTTVPTGALAALTGAVVDLEFQYTTASSRNDPANGITNKVDLFVDGVAAFTVTETCVVTSQTLSATSTDALYVGNFERVGGAGSPSATNRFMRLGNAPVVSFPSTITVGSTVYAQNTHYWLLQGTTSLAGSQLEVCGLEWAAAGVPDNTQLVLNYSYNQVPQLLDAVIAGSKQICTDVLVHQADYQYVTTCLTIEYSRNYAVTTTNAAIVNRLQIFYQTLDFGSPVIFSQLEAAVQQVLGVNEVHVTTEAENGAAYGVQVFDNSSDVVPTTTYTDDFVLNDNQVAVYQNFVGLQAPNIGGGGS